MIQFEHPIVFLALIPLVPYLWYCHHKSYADLTPGRRALSLVLRSLALLLVLLGLSKPVLSLTNSDEAILFVVDVSDSSPPEASTP